MFEDLNYDYKEIIKNYEDIKSTNNDYERLINDLKEDNKKLRLETTLNIKETKSIKCQTDKSLLIKTIN